MTDAKTAAAIAFLAGTAALFGTYWDDAWHTDRGRDDFFIAPHLTLYGGVLDPVATGTFLDRCHPGLPWDKMGTCQRSNADSAGQSRSEAD